jgi:hypothetical protein
MLRQGLSSYDHPLCCASCIFLSSLYITSSFFEVVFLAWEVCSLRFHFVANAVVLGLLVIDVLYLEALAHNHDNSFL